MLRKWHQGLWVGAIALMVGGCASSNQGYDKHSYCERLATQVNSTEDLNTQTRQTAINYAQSIQAYNRADCQTAMTPPPPPTDGQ